MANFTVTVESASAENPVVPGAKILTVTGITNFLTGAISGAKLGTSTIVARGNAVAASGTLTVTATTGSLTATINGVAVTVTAGAAVNANAILLRDAINASTNPLVAGHVVATSSGAIVTIKAKNLGLAGNAVTLAATGGTASGARLAGGTETLATFSV